MKQWGEKDHTYLCIHKYICNYINRKEQSFSHWQKMIIKIMLPQPSCSQEEPSNVPLAITLFGANSTGNASNS